MYGVFKMGIKMLVYFCLQTLLLKVISSQCINAPDIADCVSFGPAPYFYGPVGGLAACSGGGLQVNSYSPIAPTGLSIFSENVIEGPVYVGGLLPFLSAVSLEGTFPSSGLGSIWYSCGDEAIGIDIEGPIAPDIAVLGPCGLGMGFAPGPFFESGFGYGPESFFGPGMSYGPGLVGFESGKGYGSGLGFGSGLSMFY